MRIKIILAVFFFFTTLTFNVESSVFPPDLLSDNGYRLDEASPPGLVTGLLEIPNTVSTMLIGFQFLNVGDGDWLSVHIGDA